MTASHERQVFDAKLRTQKGSAFRAANPTHIPGVVYGKSIDPISVAMDSLSVERIFSHLGHSTIFDLNIPEQTKPISVLLHEVERHPNSNQLVHFDLYAVTLDQKIKTEISIHFEGESSAQSDSEKNIVTVTDSVEIEALPNDLPDQITIDISDLIEVGDAKYVHDIKLGDKVVILTDPETALIKVDQARVEEEEPEPVEEADNEEADDGNDQEQSDDEDGSDSKQEDS